MILVVDITKHTQVVVIVLPQVILVVDITKQTYTSSSSNNTTAGDSGSRLEEAAAAAAAEKAEPPFLDEVAAMGRTNIKLFIIPTSASPTGRNTPKQCIQCHEVGYAKRMHAKAYTDAPPVCAIRQ